MSLSASWLSISSMLSALVVGVAIGGGLEKFGGSPKKKKNTEPEKARTPSPKVAAELQSTRPNGSPPVVVKTSRADAPKPRPATSRRQTTSVLSRGDSVANGILPIPTAPRIPAGGLTAGERRLVNALPFAGRRNFANKRTGGR